MLRKFLIIAALSLFLVNSAYAQDRGIPVFKSITKYTVLGGLGGAMVATVIWLTDPLSPNLNLGNLALQGMGIGFTAGMIYGINNAYNAAYRTNEIYGTPGSPADPVKSQKYPNGPYYPTRPNSPYDPNFRDPSLEPPDTYPYYDQDYKDLYQNDRHYFNDNSSQEMYLPDEDLLPTGDMLQFTPFTPGVSLTENSAQTREQANSASLKSKGRKLPLAQFAIEF